MNIAVYLAATSMVVAETMKTIEQEIWGQTMCSQRSRVLSECKEFAMPRMAAKTVGGAESNNVLVWVQGLFSYDSRRRVSCGKFILSAEIED